MDKIKIGIGEYDPAEWFARAIIDSHTDYDTDPDGNYSCVFCEYPMKKPEDETAYHSDTCPVAVARKFIKEVDAKNEQRNR